MSDLCQSSWRSQGRLTRVNREEQSTAHLVQLLIQVLPPDGGLHDDVHILLVELDNLVHIGKVDADTAKRGRKVTSCCQKNPMYLI